jgi:hypothetical protein
VKEGWCNCVVFWGDLSYMIDHHVQLVQYIFSLIRYDF